MREHYERHNANVSRSVHTLGTEATAAYEGARAKVAAFIGARVAGRDRVHQELHRGDQPGRVRVLQRRWTGGDPRFRLGPGDEIVISEMEHHSNIVPWQLLCQRTGATLRWFGITDEGRLDESDAGRADQRAHQARLARAHVQHPRHDQRTSPRIVARAREVGALVHAGRLAVGAAPAGRRGRRCGADFIAFTGHKMLGPTGIGVLWGRCELLAAMPPFLGGGSMIETVTMARLHVRRRRRPGSRPAPRRSPRRSASARRWTT